jgi:hypothetical protein
MLPRQVFKPEKEVAACNLAKLHGGDASLSLNQRTSQPRQRCVAYESLQIEISYFPKAFNQEIDTQMAKFTRLLISACVAVVALALFAGPALALRSIQTSNPGAQQGTGVNVSFEEEGRFLRTVCSGLTLRGEANERVAKTVGAAVGNITEGRTTGCRAFGFLAATITVEATAAVPFRMRYQSILGTLPVITGILTLTEGVKFTINAGERECRYEGRSGFLFPVTREARGALTYEGGSFLAEPKARLRAGSTESCPAEGSLRGSLRFERTRTVTLV